MKVPDQAIQLLHHAEAPVSQTRAVIGLDGFVDRIIRVVDKKQRDGSETYLQKIPDFGARILAAAGKSTKFELSIQQIKLGGNGPIMAGALASFGVPLTCIGNLGDPEPHAVFQPMKRFCKLLTIADAGYTDALEFDDGKLMLSSQQACEQVTWNTIERVIGKEAFLRLLDEANFIALNNWSALPHMSEIWKRCQAEVCPSLSKKNRHLFFDLADPGFRLAEDIREALDLIAKFESFFSTTLGLNQKEAAEVAEILNLTIKGNDDREYVQRSAEAIRSKLGIHGVVVHATAFAAAASTKRSALIDGPFAEKPLISTGAGDHFNAGYNLGQILGGELEECLQLGVATSGYYVRTAQSPSLLELRSFLQQIR